MTRKETGAKHCCWCRKRFNTWTFFLLILLVATLLVLLPVHFYCLPSPRYDETNIAAGVSGILVPPLKSDDNNNNNEDSQCTNEYTRVTSNMTQGLTKETLERSQAYVGNRERVAKLAQKLQAREQPVHVAVCGGSITLGHGLEFQYMRYSDQLETWLNQYYPISRAGEKLHKVFNMGSHGADMCAMAKRINFLNLPRLKPDLFVLEFGVNDYQGQDHKVHLDHKTDVFFQGFQALATCAEVVVYRLLSDFPDAAVVFLEFQTAILNRKTAQLLHTGVAQHYQVPLISYADALFPHFYQLVEKLKPFDYSVPNSQDIDSIQPYPHGCTICHPDYIVEQFRPGGCKSVCTFMERSGLRVDSKKPCDVHGQPCYVSFLAHDAVHPSPFGHQMATDFLVQWIADTARHQCRGRKFAKHFLPMHSGWLVAGPNFHVALHQQSDFVLVQDTLEMFGKRQALTSNQHTEGFQLRGDMLADRMGWQANNTKGGESILFDINLPEYKCYEVFLSVLRSYETVGTFSATVLNKVTGKATQPKMFDCLWEPRISIPSDFKLTSHDGQCTGNCQVTVRTHAIVSPFLRKGNKIKITSLAVRKCSTQVVK